MAMKIRHKSKTQPNPDTPSLRCAHCYEHPKRFGGFGLFFPNDGSSMLTYVLCATCIRELGSKPSPTQLARIESYIISA